MAKKPKAGTRKFKGGVSRNAAKQSRGAQYGHLNLPKGIRIFKEEPKARVDLDILPYEVTSDVHPDRDDEYGIAVPGELWYKRPYWLHRNIGSNNTTVVCPTSIKKPCPICEYRAQLLKDGADYKDETVQSLRASLRNLYVVIPKGNKNFLEEPHIWDISQFLFQDKLNEEVQENEEYEAFPDLEDGFTLRIRFSEESIGTNKFASTSRIDFVDRKKAYDDSILEQVPDLDSVLNVQSYKALSSLFYGDLIGEEDEEDEDEAPARLKKTPARATPPAEEEEDEEEEDEEEEDEEEEDEEEEDEEEPEPEPPKKQPPKKQAPAPQTKKAGKAKCPYNHEFGTDADEYDECEKCDLWEECMDASG